MRACNQYRKRLTDYLRKLLPAEEEKELVGHLADCAECQQELKKMEGVLAVLQQEKGLDLPQTFWTEMSENINAEVEQVRAKRPVFKLAWVLTPAAAVIVLFLAVNLFKVDQSNLAKKESLPEGSLAWLEVPADSNHIEQELNQALAELSQEVEEAYWEEEDLSTLLAELSEKQFKTLTEEIKAEKF